MTVITATKEKETKESKCGIAFGRGGEEFPMTIKLVKEEGLFADTDLRPGMVVLEINGKNMTWATPREAADELRQSEAGEVSITVTCFVGKMTKSSADETVGISLKNSTKRTGIFISKIEESSKLQGTELAVGQQVLYINGEECPKTTKAAIALVKEAEGKLTIVTVDPDMPKPDPEEEIQEEPEMVDEKKEEEPAVSTTEEEEDEDEDDGEPKDRAIEVSNSEEGEPKKGLLDSMFSACIC